MDDPTYTYVEMFAGYTPPPDPGRDNPTPGQVRLGEARGQGDPGPADAAVKPELDLTPPCARSTLPSTQEGWPRQKRRAFFCMAA